MISAILQDVDLHILNTGQPTYLSPSYGTLSAIDVSSCSSLLLVELEWYVLDDLHNSDQFPAMILLQNVNPLPINPSQRWMLHRADWDMFSKLVGVDKWDPHNVNTNCKTLTEAILNAAYRAIPQRKTSNRKSLPWFDSSCRNAIRARRKAYRKFRSDLSTTSFIQFKKARAQARRLIRERKAEYWRNYVSTVNSNTPVAEVWRKIRGIQGKNLSSPIFLSIDSELTADADAVAEKLADSFTIAEDAFDGKFLQSRRQEEANKLYFDSSTDEVIDYNLPFSMWELEFSLKLCKGLSPGPDNVLYEMIRRLPLEVKSIQLQLYNQIWQKGVIPDDWKLAHIVPILLASSYRPISLISCLGKVLERMVNRRLQWILERGQLLWSEQSAFRRRRSTLDNLVILESEIHYAFVNKQVVVVVLFDIKNAFDSVWRFGILRALHNWGFKGNLPKFIMNYLSGTHFQVFVNGTLSTKRTTKYGVPQGSALSSTLFSIAVNGIINCLSQNVKGLLYADDLLIFCRSRSIEFARRNVQAAVNRISTCCETSGLRISAEKRKCIMFSRRRGDNPSIELNIGSQPVPCVDQVRFLGLTFDKRLNWLPHIEELRVRCFKKLRILKVLGNTSWGADRASLIKIYQALVCS